MSVASPPSGGAPDMLVVDDVTCRFGGVTAVNAVSFGVARRAILDPWSRGNESLGAARIEARPELKLSTVEEAFQARLSAAILMADVGQPGHL